MLVGELEHFRQTSTEFPPNLLNFVPSPENFRDAFYVTGGAVGRPLVIKK